MVESLVKEPKVSTDEETKSTKVTSHMSLEQLLFKLLTVR